MKNKSKKIMIVLAIIILLGIISIVLPIIVNGGNNDAKTPQVLKGKTFTSELVGVAVQGTMKNFSDTLVTKTIAADKKGVSTVALDPGYYDSIQIDASAVYDAGVTAGKNSLTGGNATAAQILSGKTAYVNGTLITGSMAQRTNGSSITSYGTDSTGPYIYFNSGYWPQANATYGSFVRMTTAQVKALATSAGIGTGLKKIGSGAGTYNLSSYTGYKNFAVGTNIICTSYSYANAYGGHNTSGTHCDMTASLGVSYNASTGVLTVTNGYTQGSDDNLSGDVYCYCNGVYIVV